MKKKRKIKEAKKEVNNGNVDMDYGQKQTSLDNFVKK